MKKTVITALLAIGIASAVFAGGSRDSSMSAGAQQTDSSNAPHSVVVIGAPSAQTGSRLGPKLDETLRKYMVPQAQTWDGENGPITYVYRLDPASFDVFKAELDAGGEYSQSGSWNERNRDWGRGEAFARWSVRPDGTFNLDLCRADNSVAGYNYRKVSSGNTPKTDELLRKYMAANQENWGEWGGDVSVFNLDATRFNEFKAEVYAGGEYFPSGIQTERNREWERGKEFAQFIVHHNGKEKDIHGGLQLRLCKSDNSVVSYKYRRWPQAGEPKTIEITGFDINIPVWTTKFRTTGRYIWTVLSNDTEFETGAYCFAVANPGQGVTFELVFDALAEDDKETEYRWTGAGLHYIHVGMVVDQSRNIEFTYDYSANGTSPTPIEIKDAVTTLKWSDFIRRD